MENTEQTQEQLSALLQVRRDKLTELQNDGRDPFKITKFERTHTSAQLKENYTEEDRELKKRGSDEVQIIKAQVSQFDGQTVSIAGRIMSKRGMGKVGFVHVSDIDGQIQLFVKKDILGEDEYARFKKLDIGDIIGAEGEVFTTQTGEISVGKSLPISSAIKFSLSAMTCSSQTQNDLKRVFYQMSQTQFLSRLIKSVHFPKRLTPLKWHIKTAIPPLYHTAAVKRKIPQSPILPLP